ncbi:hypothetical protein ONZ45_g14116 [Pleurotus djamor]|nr:hypothetical protein ONZ45_g14116 [Pleurotus djamor]
MSATASYNTPPPPTCRDQHPPPPSTPYGPDNLATSHSPMVCPGPPTIRMGRGVDQADIVVDRLFIDNLAKDMQLPPDLRGNLHHFVTMAEGAASITQGDYNLRLFSNALILQNTAEHRQYLKDNPISDFASVMTDLKLCLDDSFHLTKNQLDNCQMVSQELICQSNRLHFKSLHVDVFDLGFTNVFGKPNREAVLLGQLKRTTSSVRNAFREELRDSLFHVGKRRLLEAFSVHMVIKYWRIGVDESTSLSDIIRFALLRLFARENQDLLGVAEVVPTGSPTGSADEEAQAAAGS